MSFRAKYIIGIDGGLRNFAVSVFNNLGEHLAYKNITTRSGMLDHTAIDIIVEEFFKFVDPYMTPEIIGNKAAAVFIEDIVYSRAGDKTHARAEAIGTVKWLIRQAPVNMWGVPVKSANSFLDSRFGLPTANRKSAAQKTHTKAVVHRHCNFHTNNDNLADSYVMGLYGYAYLIEKQRLSPRPLSKLIY